MFSAGVGRSKEGNVDNEEPGVARPVGRARWSRRAGQRRHHIVFSRFVRSADGAVRPDEIRLWRVRRGAQARRGSRSNSIPPPPARSESSTSTPSVITSRTRPRRFRRRPVGPGVNVDTYGSAVDATTLTFSARAGFRHREQDVQRGRSVGGLRGLRVPGRGSVQTLWGSTLGWNRGRRLGRPLLRRVGERQLEIVLTYTYAGCHARARALDLGDGGAGFRRPRPRRPSRPPARRGRQPCPFATTARGERSGRNEAPREGASAGLRPGAHDRAARSPRSAAVRRPGRGRRSPAPARCGAPSP